VFGWIRKVEKARSMQEGSYGQLDDQDCDAGNVFDCADRRVLAHSGCCGRRRVVDGAAAVWVAAAGVVVVEQTHPPRSTRPTHPLLLTRSGRTQKPPTGSRRPASSPLFDDPAFSQGYRTAYATIYERNDYATAIEQLLRRSATMITRNVAI